MCELTYFPTTVQTIDLHKQFRFWHTESLLNQSANLIDQCLKDLTELKQLELIEFNLGQEISRAEKELEIEENKLDSFDRDLFINQNYYEELKARYPLDLQATGHAQAATTYIANVPDGSNEGRHLTNIRDVITMSEREITDVIQKHERLLTEKKEGWFADDKIKNTDYFFFRKEQLKIKKNNLIKQRR